MTEAGGGGISVDTGHSGRLSFFDGLRLAIGCLTRLPIAVPSLSAGGSLAGAMHLFPLVGVLVGAIGSAVYGLAAIGLPPALAALLAVAATALATGAMHEDGLSDVADGFGGGADRDRKLAIMKDSRLGSYGALALVLGLSLRVGALASLGAPAAVAGALIASHALGRAAIPLVMQGLMPVRTGGLGATAGQPSPSTAGIAATLALIIVAMVLPAGAAFAAALAATAATFVLGAVAWRQIGGQTGDVLGAVEQVSEIAALLAIVALQ
ncbi:adenosylcobinamide-GDP ribazoletransferase [Telmatospirillum sp.]|uniref:adenosylcobinamide-GDP ribazoletransferase n=1 Tax=Telmatospirillum sp. TaxID=2079197 RepID=UPI0028494FCB|nr:adenosylcobinamide-GDP ribazoletransferase [Telmatospirillum sp.]MDR3436998.1 adenosylcobinamide-GDP ribazoletransferase [Telmatospirillum sp.]